MWRQFWFFFLGNSRVAGIPSTLLCMWQNKYGKARNIQLVKATLNLWTVQDDKFFISEKFRGKPKLEAIGDEITLLSKKQISVSVYNLNESWTQQIASLKL